MRRLGLQLYAGNCARCHGSAGSGIRDEGPPLQGVGALAADFYLRTGYMPLAHPGEQPHRSRVLFAPHEIDALVAYVASLGHGPPIPRPQPERGIVAAGMTLFTEHCAGCHQVAAEGGYLPGAVAPPLDDATAVQIAEAVRIGPYVMPRFSRRAISDRQLDSIVRYVAARAAARTTAGGWSIGHIGPIPEGLVDLVRRGPARWSRSASLVGQEAAPVSAAQGRAARRPRCCSSDAGRRSSRPIDRAARPARPARRAARRSRSSRWRALAGDRVPRRLRARPRCRTGRSSSALSLGLALASLALRAARRRPPAARRHRGARGGLPGRRAPRRAELLSQRIVAESGSRFTRRGLLKLAGGRGGRRARRSRCSRRLPSLGPVCSTRRRSTATPWRRGPPARRRERPAAPGGRHRRRARSTRRSRRAPTGSSLAASLIVVRLDAGSARPAGRRERLGPPRHPRLLEDLHARRLRRSRSTARRCSRAREPSPALVCPCHYSTFDPATGGTVVFGPAGPPAAAAAARDRPRAGCLRAAGRFSGPVGPSWWGVRSREAKPT